MDFGKVLATISERFERAQIDWAVVGGLALTLHGLPRTTLDIDVMVDGERQGEVLAILEDLGFQCLHSSRGYSNHRHPESDWGQVDVLYVRGDTKQAILDSPERAAGPRGFKVPVAGPRHLIAMKVFAMQQSPERKGQDLADIRALAELTSVSQETVREVFERYSAKSLWDEYLS